MSILVTDGSDSETALILAKSNSTEKSNILIVSKHFPHD